MSLEYQNNVRIKSEADSLSRYVCSLFYPYMTYVRFSKFNRFDSEKALKPDALNYYLISNIWWCLGLEILDYYW